MTKNSKKSSNNKFTHNSNLITNTEVALIFNNLMQGNRMLISKTIGEPGSEEWGNLRWGDKKIINEVLASNPDLNLINVNWFWVKHNYIKLLSLVLNIEKSCNLPTSNLANNEIEHAINCIKNDSKFNVIKINWDKISTKDKKDFFSEVLNVSQKIKEFSIQPHPSIEDICKEAYQDTNDKENFRCNIADGQYVDISYHKDHQSKTSSTRKLLSFDENNIELFPNEHPLLPFDNNDNIEPSFSNNSSFSLTALGLLFFPLPILITFCICACYHYCYSSNEQEQDFTTELLADNNNHHEE